MGSRIGGSIIMLQWQCQLLVPTVLLMLLAWVEVWQHSSVKSRSWIA